MERTPNTQYILSRSYGKDSLACLGAIASPGAALCPFLPRLEQKFYSAVQLISELR